MIDFLEGTLVEKQPTRAVIACGGVGYEVFIPLTTHANLPPAGDSVRLLTILQIREDAQLLFGFACSADRDMFRLLISVAGVGPRIALAAMSRLESAELESAIAREDVRSIRSIPGVGLKLATRIVTELRDTVLTGRSVALAGSSRPAPQTAVRDAEMALVALGYKPDDARRAVADAARDNPAANSDIESLIRAAISGCRRFGGLYPW